MTAKPQPVLPLANVQFSPACDSSCSTCAGSSTFCLTCANNQLASSGKCVSSCPSDTFSSSGACLTCHPDCASCSGSSFNQCSSCNTTRPVLTNGRCLPTCSQSQFYDTTSSTCQTCDSSCSSCSGNGPSNCLACSNSGQVLQGGTCVTATCTNSSSVIPGLGVCLSDLVKSPTGTSATPLPSITGLTTPVVVARAPLAWWQILLMTLGCAFIFLCFLMCWRRRARKQRANKTARFVSAKALDRKLNWRYKLLRFGERLFGHDTTGRDDEVEEIKLEKLRNAEEARHHAEMEKLMGLSNYKAGSARGPSSSSSSLHSSREDRRIRDSLGVHSEFSRPNSMSAGSLYSQVTGMPRRTPEPRQPVKENPDQLPSRFSLSTFSSSVHLPKSSAPSEAESYAKAMRDGPSSSNGVVTSRNPFHKDNFTT